MARGGSSPFPIKERILSVVLLAPFVLRLWRNESAWSSKQQQQQQQRNHHDHDGDHPGKARVERTPSVVATTDTAASPPKAASSLLPDEASTLAPALLNNNNNQHETPDDDDDDTDDTIAGRPHPTTANYHCPHQMYLQGHWEPRNKTYTWQVDNLPNTTTTCTLQPLTRQALCDSLHGRSVLVVGDSINLQFYKGLVRALGYPLGDIQVLTWYKTHGVHMTVPGICHDWNRTRTTATASSRNLQPPQQQSLTFIRSDTLAPLRNASEDEPLIQPWVTHLTDYPILILNSGAHAPGIREYRQRLKRVREALHDYNGTVIFRTTPRGHQNCSRRGQAAISHVNSEEWLRFFPVMTTTTNGAVAFAPPNLPTTRTYKYKYKWDRFPTFNQIMYQEFGPEARHNIMRNANHNHNNVSSSSLSSSSSPNWCVIDVAPINELRPDGHFRPPRDCLHYQEWSDIYQTWVMLLMNALQGYLEC